MRSKMFTQNKISNHVLFSTTLLLVSLGCVFGQQYSSQIRCFDNERQALLKFKDELVDEYGRLSSWGVGTNKRECCNWIGVHCHNRTNHVAQLNLRGSVGFNYGYPFRIAPLKGNISTYLAELKHLTYLDLSCNDFCYSSIPKFIGSFEKLWYLNLSNANLSKSIPWNVGSLSELMYLDFSWNHNLYSKNLDWVSNLGSLKYLDLSYVGLDKASNWLQAIFKLSSLKELNLAHCGVQDIAASSLPSTNASAPLAILDLSLNPSVSPHTFQWFLNFSKSLTFIDLSNNDITSLDPAFTFDNQIFLAHLDLSSNSLEGGIPKSLGNMSSLMYLNLQWNHLTARLSELMTNLSGPLEKKLLYLDLSHNMISGSLPNLSRFSFLNQLDLGWNELNGSITKGFLNIPNLIHLDLSANHFTGTLPDLKSYQFLQRLYLNNNMFRGHLRESIGNMSKLEALVVGSNNLEGIVNESHFSSLSSLQILDLSYNPLLTLNCSPQWIPPFQLRVISLSKCNIGPRFPQWLQFQRKLEFLEFSSSQVVDTIPSWFGNVASSLICLNASNNQIHGDFPEIGFSSAFRKALDLSGNKITGQATFLCHYVGWISIDLSDNLFSEHLPDCFANNTSLMFLNLANNNISGEIPDSFGSLRWLSLLNLRNNSFSGGIPTFLRNCTQLDMIDLGQNRLTGNIPTWIGDDLSPLIVLSLRFNELNGTIPSSICRLQHIQVLDLSSNKISGIIPKCLYNLTAMIDEPSDFASRSFSFLNLLGARVVFNSLLEGVYFMWKGKEINYVNRLKFVQLIDLSNNVLAGDIPTEITKLIALSQMNLSRNNLTGFIPHDISLMRSLDSLDLSRNQLSGGIPTSLSELSFLGVLNLSYNNLSGRIPPQLLKFDESSFTGNSGLCGRPILNKSCLGDGQDPNFDDDGKATNNLEDDDDDDDEFITEGFYICTGVGFVVGFWGIFGTILLNKSARFAYFKLLHALGDLLCNK